jgi:hypothetical protein
MNRLFTLGALVGAVCIFAPASDAGSAGSNPPKTAGKVAAVRAEDEVHADSTLRVVPSGLPARSASLSRGLQALLSYNAGSGDFYPVPADTAAPKKKKQVKKTDRSYESEPKEGEKQTSEEEEGSFLDNCVTGLIESLCDGIFGGDSKSEVVAVSGSGGTTVVSGPRVGTMVTPEEFPYAGVVRPLRADNDDVTVWEAPGGDTTTTRTMGTLRRGTRVIVADRTTRYGASESAGVVWVKVDRVGAPQPGWILGDEVVPAGAAPIELPERPAIASAPSAPSERHVIESGPTPDIAESRWQIAASVSVPVFGEQDLRDEYAKNASRVGLESKALLARSIQVGGSLGYLRSNGESKFAYVGTSTIDSPVRNRLEVWDFGLSVGQLFSFAGGSGFFTYAVGPGVFHVRERADIEVLEDGSLVDARTDRLSAWKFGGTAEVGVGGLAGGRIPIAFQTRFHVFPWESNEEKSLTLEYLEGSVIYILSFGVTVGVAFF